jgi:hypothetical protein
VTRGPIVLGALYVAVVGDSPYCQCQTDRPGGCGEKHARTGGACSAPQRAGMPLQVVPTDATLPVHVAVTLPPGDLIALCRKCAAHRASTAAAARRQQLAETAADSQQSLF